MPQERVQVGEREDAETEGRVDHVVLVVLGQRPGLEHVAAARVDQSLCALNTFCTSRRLPELCGPKRRRPPMSMSPMLSRVATNTGSGCEVLAWTFWPIRVRLKPTRLMLTVFGDTMRRYSPVKNWLREMKLRGNCG